MVTVSIDAMGGDFGCTPIVEGLLQALDEKQFKAILVGDTEKLRPLIPKKYQEFVSYEEASEVFGMEEVASAALKRRETSIYKAVQLVKDKKADGIVSAGHSGATMGLATLRIGRLSGVSRPAIATLMPTHTKGSTLVLDVGANVDCKADNLFEFGLMGQSYAKDVLGKGKPRIGLLSNGEEESKGNEVNKNAFALLKKLDGFVGNVEGNDIFNGSVDVVVCDGFVGNILLKTSEGVAGAISSLIKQDIKKSPLAMLGAFLMKKVFKELKTQVDYAEYGGAPLLGVDGCAIVSHGKSNAKAIKNAIFQAINFANSKTNEDIVNDLKKFA